MRTREISNQDDIIDSRDVIARLKYLQGEVDSGDAADYEYDEFHALEPLDKEGRDTFGEWRDGVTLVADSHFEDFARQEAEDLGLIQSDARWPATHIDWRSAAEELQNDYTSIDFDGETFWGRST